MTRHKLMLDVGGTFIKCSDGRSIPVDSGSSRENIISSFKEAVGKITGNGCIAVAIPGPFDYEKGIFMMKHKFAAVYGESFADLVGAPRDVEFRYIHDVNCMLLGEMSAGNARKYENAALVSVGTGLGFAMCIGREIQKNASGSPAVSIYNMPYGDGILEDYVSIRGITRLYSRFSGVCPVLCTVKDIAGKAHSGDAAARKAFMLAGHIIGDSIAPLIEKYRIECLLFGGQISRSFDLMEEAVKEELSGTECLETISTVSDFDNATFNGLKAL